jgi:DNA-binding response OmpR family regulator
MKQEKILLVDDEEIILETVDDDLRKAGFNVVQANLALRSRTSS